MNRPTFPRMAKPSIGSHRDDYCPLADYEVGYAQRVVGETFGFSTTPKHRAAGEAR